MIARPLLLTSLLFAAAFAFPRPALSKDGPPGPDGLPTADKKHPWHFFVGEPSVDTLRFDMSEVVPAARRQFEADQWIVFEQHVRDGEAGFVLTRWKQIHHPLIWLFMGKTMARCKVDLSALGPGRTRVSFRAELGSHHKLEGNPVLPAARKAYAKAARNWFHDTTTDLRSRARSHERPGIRRQEPTLR